jgi:hypothetical protein
MKGSLVGGIYFWHYGKQDVRDVLIQYWIK